MNINKKKLVIKENKYKGDSAVVSARIPSDLIDKLDEIAERTGKKRNEIILLCLEFAVDNLVIKEEEYYE